MYSRADAAITERARVPGPGAGIDHRELVGFADAAPFGVQMASDDRPEQRAHLG